MALGSTELLTEITSRDLPPKGGGGAKRPVRIADNFANFMFRFSESPGSLNLLDPSRLSMPEQE
jgi:hypothetical protein